MSQSYQYNNNIYYVQDRSSNGNNSILSFITEDSSQDNFDMGQIGNVYDSVSRMSEKVSDVDRKESEPQPMSFQSDESRVFRSIEFEFEFDQDIPMNLNKTVKVTSGFKHMDTPRDRVFDQDSYDKGEKKKKRKKDRFNKFQRSYGVSDFNEFGEMFA